MRIEIVAVAAVTFVGGVAAADCATGFSTCQPNGSKTTTLPPVGEELAPLYENLLESVKGISVKRDVGKRGGLVERQDGPSICCAENTSCLNLESMDLPFCYDRFTTNFVLADGTYGTLDDGTLQIKDGPTVNLQNGTISGSSDNIYGDSPPDTSTLPIPTPYTASGVGSAIPISALAGVITLTSVIEGTTIAATTVSAFSGEITLILSSGVNEVDGMTFTASEAITTTVTTTEPGTTVPETTVAARTTTIVSTASGASETSDNGATVPTAVAHAGLAGMALAFVVAL